MSKGKKGASAEVVRVPDDARYGPSPLREAMRIMYVNHRLLESLGFVRGDVVEYGEGRTQGEEE